MAAGPASVAFPAPRGLTAPAGNASPNTEPLSDSDGGRRRTLERKRLQPAGTNWLLTPIPEQVKKGQCGH